VGDHLAVDFAYIYENTSPVYDEMIAHRLGLLVLDSNKAVEKYRSPEECAGKEPSEAENCYAVIHLSVSTPADGPGRYVTASELEIDDPDVKPVYPDTPLIYLGPGQEVYLVAYARLGRGREHAKWSPASISALRYTPVVRYDASRASEECIKCLEAYPQLVEALRRGGSGVVELRGVSRTSALRYCAEAVCNGAVEVSYDSSNLELEIEGTGALRPEKIVAKALEILGEKVKRFAEAVERAGVKEE
jgi:DNA-directed RNA polymerase subunit D